MALTGITTKALLSTAGLSPDQFGLMVAMDAANRSVMLPLVRRYNIERGANLYIPKVGTRSATARTAGTDDGVAPTYAALSDTKITMTQRFAYDAAAIGWETLDNMPPAHLNAWLQAERTQMAAALANDIDSQLLSLYSSADTTIGTSGDETTYANLILAVKTLRVANAPEPYFAVLPETQWDHLAGIDELTRFDIRGEGDTMQNRQAFKFHGVTIFTTGNVPTAAGAAHGLVFSGEGLAIALRSLVEVNEWSDPNTFANKMSAHTSYAYANTFSDWIVDFATKDA